jgi:hypothetical protein
MSAAFLYVIIFRVLISSLGLFIYFWLLSVPCIMIGNIYCFVLYYKNMKRKYRTVNFATIHSSYNRITGRPRLTNIRTYDQTTDVHLPGPANSCSRYEHVYRHVGIRFRVPNLRLTNGNLERNPFVSWGPPVVANQNLVHKHVLIKCKNDIKVCKRPFTSLVVTGWFAFAGLAVSRRRFQSQGRSLSGWALSWLDVGIVIIPEYFGCGSEGSLLVWNMLKGNSVANNSLAQAK